MQSQLQGAALLLPASAGTCPARPQLYGSTPGAAGSKLGPPAVTWQELERKWQMLGHRGGGAASLSQALEVPVDQLQHIVLDVGGGTPRGSTSRSAEQTLAQAVLLRAGKIDAVLPKEAAVLPQLAQLARSANELAAVFDAARQWLIGVMNQEKDVTCLMSISGRYLTKEVCRKPVMEVMSAIAEWWCLLQR